jgi:TM2 domain-containing membrane protein YozV
MLLFECVLSCLSNRSFGPSSPLYYLSAGSLVPRITLSGLHRLYIIRVRDSLSLESFFWAFLYIIRVRALLSHESLFRSFINFILFEYGLLCHSNHSFRPSAALYYSSAGSLVSRIALSGLHRLGIIRVRALLSLKLLFWSFIAFILLECRLLCPLNHSFGPSTPLYYSSADSLVPRIALLGLHRFYIIRVRASLSLESFFRAFSAFILFECRLSCLSNRSFGPAAPWYYSSAGSLVP